MTTGSQEPTRPETAASPEEMLRAVVSGAKPPAPPAPQPRTDPRRIGLVAAGIAFGALAGVGGTLLTHAVPDHARSVLADMAAGLDAQRIQAATLSGELDRLGTTIAALRTAADAADAGAKARDADLAKVMSRAEHGVIAKITGLTERLDQADREQGTRIAALTAQIEKRSVVSTTAPKPEPAVTGSIPEAKPKPAVIEGWAVRDVYAGTAMLEDRRRRLVEVAVGDAIPGVGRVDGVERRGRDWVVVTRQGIVTSQPW